MQMCVMAHAVTRLDGLVASGGARHEDKAENSLGDHVKNTVDEHLRQPSCQTLCGGNVWVEQWEREQSERGRGTRRNHVCIGTVCATLSLFLCLTACLSSCLGV